MSTVISCHYKYLHHCHCKAVLIQSSLRNNILKGYLIHSASFIVSTWHQTNHRVPHRSRPGYPVVKWFSSACSGAGFCEIRIAGVYAASGIRTYVLLHQNCTCYLATTPRSIQWNLVWIPRPHRTGLCGRQTFPPWTLTTPQP